MIKKLRPIPSDQQEALVWGGLARFQDVSFVKEAIIKKHNLEKQHWGNAKKQATQIRSCLRLATEYFEASKSVSLASKPTLLYYSTMYFAIAEILYKQTGDSNLELARAEHAHHGLLFIHSKNIKSEPSIIEQLKSLGAKPMFAGERRKGTFDLWHRTAREHPVLGNLASIYNNNTSKRLHLAAFGSVHRLPLFPLQGVSLYECMKLSPLLEKQIFDLGLEPFVVRADLTIENRTVSKESHFTLIFQPGKKADIDLIVSQCRFLPENWSNIEYLELNSGGGVAKWIVRDGSRYGIQLPNAISANASRIFFLPEGQPLNEFGILYVTLFILGNLARYYADQWIPLIEESSKFAQYVEACLAMAVKRVPLLALCELSETYWIAE